MAPFDMTGVIRTADGILRYSTLASSMLASLKSSVDRHPDREAIVIVGGERVTYQQLWDRSARVAGGLRASGVRQGDRVANRHGNSLEWCLGFWGVLMAGAVVVPVNTRFTEPEADYVIGDADARVVLHPNAALPDGEPYVDLSAGHDTLAAIFYTSGTTGFPKGAMLTHENFLSNSESCRRVLDVSADMPIRYLVSLPLFHVFGCNCQLVFTLELGGTTVIMPVFEAQSFLRAAVDERITMLASVPAIFWLVMNQNDFDDFDLSRIGWVIYGGAPTAPQMVARMRRSFPGARLGNGFGLTETSASATFLPDEYAELRPESVGFPPPPVEIDLRDPDPETGVGELLIRGQNVVTGYWNKPAETAKSFVDGWFHTGDLARVDEDGFIQIVDRLKDMINRGGENVYCVEVENVLLSHPAVFEAAVVGVPDAVMGEKVGAVVVLRPGREVSPADIRTFVADRLADFAVPQYVSLRTEPLPRNAAGKVLKATLRSETAWGRTLAN